MRVMEQEFNVFAGVSYIEVSVPKWHISYTLVDSTKHEYNTDSLEHWEHPFSEERILSIGITRLC